MSDVFSVLLHFQKEKKDSNLMFLEVEFPSAFCDEIGSVYDIAYYEKVTGRHGIYFRANPVHAQFDKFFELAVCVQSTVQGIEHAGTPSHYFVEVYPKAPNLPISFTVRASLKPTRTHAHPHAHTHARTPARTHARAR